MVNAVPVVKQLSAGGRSAGAAPARRRLWLFAFAAALGLCLGVVAWFTNDAIEEALHRQLADQLQTILRADVESLRIWIHEQEVDAELFAAAAPLFPAATELAALADGSDAGLLQSAHQAVLRADLQPQLKRYGYTGFFLVSPSLRIIASNDDAVVGKPLDGYRAEFYKGVLAGKPAVSRPYRSPQLLPNERGELKTGLPTIFTAAPIRDAKGRVVAVLGLRIPERAFTRVMQIAQAGATGETFAFDKSGLFLSHSRFDDALKRAGLLADLADADSMLTLELRDPGANVMAGERPPPRAEQPLSRMATDAVAGNSGVDVAGFRGYRGVPVLAAWTWLPEYEFGVATQIDAAEAHRPLVILRTTFFVLLGLIALGAAAVFASLVVLARQRRRVEKAERTVRQLGQYTLEEMIGSGGMGSVYRARHAFLRRPTAIKMINTSAASEDNLKRFEREVQLTSSLNHPNTICIYDYGRTPEGVFYYAMECLDGITLEDLVKRYGPLPERRVVGILYQICGSLAEAHAIGLIHRDIKPANVILTNRAGIPDFVKVLDFGLVKITYSEDEARLTRANVAVGTPYYMAPEAVERPDTITASADIYAIGAVGYFLLTGTPVFTGKTIMEVCQKHARATPELPSKRLGRPVSAVLELLIIRCLAKTPADRPANVRVMMEELAHLETAPRWSDADAEAWWLAFRGAADTNAGAATKENTAITAG